MCVKGVRKEIKAAIGLSSCKFNRFFQHVKKGANSQINKKNNL